MKIQIDTDNKIVKILEDTNIGMLVEMLKDLLKEDFNSYTIKAVEMSSIPWIDPIIIPYPYPLPTTAPYTPFTNPYPAWDWPITICGTTGVYNVEVISAVN